VHVFVEFLLAEGEGFSADVFASEVAGEAVDDDEADVVFFDDFVGVFEEEDLVVAGVGVGDDDVFGYLLWVEVEVLCHLDYAFGAEGVFGVDV